MNEPTFDELCNRQWAMDKALTEVAKRLSGFADLCGDSRDILAYLHEVRHPASGTCADVVAEIDRIASALGETAEWCNNTYEVSWSHGEFFIYRANHVFSPHRGCDCPDVRPGGE